MIQELKEKIYHHLHSKPQFVRVQYINKFIDESRLAKIIEFPLSGKAYVYDLNLPMIRLQNVCRQPHERWGHSNVRV
jgi:hypothetical protein